MNNPLYTENHLNIVLGFVLSFAITYFLIPIISKIGIRYGIQDIPNERKQHEKPVVRMGGIAIATSCLITLFIISKLIPPNIYFFETNKYLILILCLFFSFLLGLIDDIFTISPWPRLTIQFALAILLWSGGISINSLNFSWIADSNFNISLPNIISLVITTFWLVGFTNALNWIDGLNGLAGGISLISLFGNLFIAFCLGNINSFYLSLTLIGSICAFLRFNKNPAKILMGDGGSYFLGYSLGSISLINYSDKITYPFFIVIILFSVPLIDMLYVILNRIRISRSPFKPDRLHIHYRLIKSGFSPTESTFLLLFLTKFSVILAVSLFLQIFNILIITFSGLICLSYYLYLKLKLRS